MSEISFTRHDDTSLFTADACERSGYLAFYITGEDDADNDLTLTETWNDYVGLYVFLPAEPASIDTFHTDLEAFLGVDDDGNVSPEYSVTNSSFLWLDYPCDLFKIAFVTTTEVPPADPPPDPPEDPPYDCTAEDAKVVVAATEIIAFGGYRIHVTENMRVVFNYKNDAGATDSCPNGFTFEFPKSPVPVCPPTAVTPAPSPDLGMRLMCIGDRSGCLQAMALVDDYSETPETGWYVGLQYVVSVDGEDVSQFYPVFDLCDGRRPLLWMCWDPLDHFDTDRTFLSFLGDSVRWKKLSNAACDYQLQAIGSDIIPTYFRTVAGRRVGFIPVHDAGKESKLVFELRTAVDAPGNACYYLVPSGEYELAVLDEHNNLLEPREAEADFPSKFMCGLSGIESVEYVAHEDDDDYDDGVCGDRICFFPHKPAYAPVYPVIPGPGVVPSPLLNPRKGDALLMPDYRTAWASFHPCAGGGPSRYLAQPEDGPYFATRENILCGGTALLQLVEPRAEFLPAPGTDASFPIAPIAGAEPDCELGDSGITFLKTFEAQVLSPFRRQQIRTIVVAAQPQGYVTPPSGAETDRAATAQGIIAQIAEPRWKSIQLANRAATTSKIKFDEPNQNIQAAFQSNKMFLVASRNQAIIAENTVLSSDIKLGDWMFRLNMADNVPGTYKNTLIFKFSPGRIVDLVQQPKAWLNAETFNNSGAGQIDAFVAWLTAYINNGVASSGGDPGYQRFAEIVQDPNWTGVLGLNVKVNFGDLPTELKVLTAGIDQNAFVAHHIIVDSSSVSMCGSTPVPGESSMYGLIDYEKPKRDPNVEDPTLTREFDFSVRKLRARFENAVVKEFACVAELTINRLFGESIRRVVSDTPGAANRITIIGRREEHNGTEAYVFTLSGTGTYELVSTVIASVEIRRVGWSAQQIGEDAAHKPIMRCPFVFAGAIAFQVTGPGFDLFSYQPLVFENLLLEMQFTLGGADAPTFEFIADRTSFDLAAGASTPRANSLVRRFPMRLQSMVQSHSSTPPATGGYAPVSLPVGVKPLTATWFGLEFTLNLGTLGEFASNAGITVRLMLAWSPNGTDLLAQVLLKFPGVTGMNADLFSIQGVLKFGASSYQLKSYGTGGYMLVLNSIALRVLGISIPTGGGPSLYIFGNPNPPAPDDDNLGWLAMYKKRA